MQLGRRVCVVVGPLVPGGFGVCMWCSVAGPWFHENLALSRGCLTSECPGKLPDKLVAVNGLRHFHSFCCVNVHVMHGLIRVHEDIDRSMHVHVARWFKKGVN